MLKLLCICGPNGAGKSTFSRTIAMRENLLVIDPDKLAAEGLSPIGAGKAAARMARLFLKEGVSFARKSTLTAKFDLTLMQEAKQRDYEVELIYICLASAALAQERIAARASRGGHSVPPPGTVRRLNVSLLTNPLMALRGAEGDRRAQRGSSRSRCRAALVG